MVFSIAACTASQEADMLLDSPEPVVIHAESTPGSWQENDMVTLRMDGESKMYRTCFEQGVILKAAPSVTPFMWRSQRETKRVSGWSRGNGEAMSEIPSEWSVASDQNSDDGAGMRQSDLLYASPTGLTYTDRFHARINFRHQTSKIMVRIKNEGILKDDPAVLEGLTIGDESSPVVMKAHFEEVDGEDFGRWTLSGEKADMGYVIPHETASGTVSYQKSYEALVIPDNFDRKPLLAITLMGHTYYYIPQNRQGRLTPGHIFIYDISVSADTTKLIVTPMIGDNLVWTWEGDGIVSEDDQKSSEFFIEGWIWDRSSDTEVTSGVIPLGIGPDGWRKEGDGNVTIEDEHPDSGAGSDGWNKEGDDQEASQEEQPGGVNADGGSGWTQEGESENITSTTE